jgi:hypothetical protein
MLVILLLRRLRQEEFKASLDYLARPCFIKKQQKLIVTKYT